MAFLSPPPPPPGGPFVASFSSPLQPSFNVTPFVPARRRTNAAFAFKVPFLSKRTYTFSSYSVLERNALPLSVVDEHLAPLKNRPLQEEQVVEALDALQEWYKANYYVTARIMLEKLPTKRKPHLQLRAIEPNLVVLSTVSVGADNKPDRSIQLVTRPIVIANALGVEEGKPFIWSPSGFARLIALGVFEHINAEVKLHTPRDAELILYLRERKPGRLEPGAGISSDGRVYGDISLVDSNFMGRAQRVRIEWQKRLDVPRASGGIAFEDMRIGARVPLSFRMKAYRDANAERNLPQQAEVSRPPVPAALQPDAPLRYESDRDGVLFDVGYRPASKSIMFNLSPMLERVHRTGYDPTDSGCVQGVLQTCVTHATRPHIDLPRSGHIVRIEQAVGTKLYETPRAFYKTVLKIAKYVAVGPHASLACGLTASTGSENLPFHEQKSLGGHGTIRGYGHGELGRHRSFAVGRMELRVPLAFRGRDQADGPNGENDKEGEGAKHGLKERDGASKSKSNGDAGEKKSDGASDEGEGGENVNLFDRMPPLVGVLFGDIGVAEQNSAEVLGASYGLGLRVGGVVSVDWTSTVDGRKSRVHFGLVDRSL